NVLLSRRFKEKRAGPVPQLTGTIELAFVSLQFKATLCATFALARAVCNCADVGRSLKIESPFKSCPSVTLKGKPELAIRNGLSRNWYGMEMLPPKKILSRTSNAARP